jgi:uncharacterized protein YdiU (UPF0061 family)
MLYHHKKRDELKALMDYTQNTFFGNRPLAEMLKEIVRRTANLMADWMANGFCHGVMNTDNMSILGLTIDYGPFGFMEDSDLNFVCNHSDDRGRYAYGQQPGIAHWNLSRLLTCFADDVPKEELQNILDSFPEFFQLRFLELGKKKLGLTASDPGDHKLFTELLHLMGKLNLDFTFTFRSLSTDLGPFRDYYGKREEFEAWFLRYEERLVREGIPSEERRKSMLKVNPKYILRNYIAQEVIEDVEAGSNHKLIQWLKVFAAPFEEHAEMTSYSMPTPYESKNIIVSCSS